ncbi:hypothetical protein A1O1_05946 [Capronia coronata CBS 617.96]|uniref:Uncharacterized protein n=1 Tax=Capronia coronata CBS 617.96 TaxID=1182541 RepID=W9Y8L2_9EURO|nr:uncharacterized protein A1O1_05946 [Capronia coronata CBS 617.96]EXJ85581.1 hypothetical protein A1O1_05946 [Capronia coronata CBS 617.96]
MEPPPPPPPPHGSNAQGGRTGGLPDGRYDIFVIPPHSAGSGFLYLPSLQTQRNSFLAGVFCTAAAYLIYTTAVPVVKEWLLNTFNSGGSGMFTIICCVGVAAWAFGKTQGEWSQSPSSASAGSNPGPGGRSGQGSTGYGTASGPQPHTQPPPPPPPPNHGTKPPPPQSSWQRPQANTKANASSAKSSWEKAREETRKREEERKRAEELKKLREELERERQKQREKDALERLERERKEKKEREEREAAAAAEKERQARAATASAGASPPKRPPMPSARTEREDDAYSFRPYDRAKRTHKANSAASMYSESSYAPSESTAKTTPPPSTRGPYSTKDPDKIIIKGVFSFSNAFMRTPISQLRSGQGNVTDGLILRITTEGLFIDDDVRGVPQREWDIKAWTIKLAEVWCPKTSPGANPGFPRRKISFAVGADSRLPSSPSQNDSSAFVGKLVKCCGEGCKAASSRTTTMHTSRSSSFSSARATNDDADPTWIQSCELGGLHVLRASIRDQEGKKYVFVLSQSEGWKVAIGLQRLRRGSQVRAMGVAGLPQNETKAILENLGFV